MHFVFCFELAEKIAIAYAIRELSDLELIQQQAVIIHVFFTPPSKYPCPYYEQQLCISKFKLNSFQ